jgi:hypothetical protein
MATTSDRRSLSRARCRVASASLPATRFSTWAAATLPKTVPATVPSAQTTNAIR